MNDRGLASRLSCELSELKHSLECGNKLTFLLWIKFGRINMLFEMLDKYVTRLELRDRIKYSSIEQAIKGIETDGELVPYMVIREAIQSIESKLRVSQAITELIDNTNT